MENRKVCKNDLRLGNIFKEGVVCKINGRTGAKVHLYGKLKWDKRIKVIDSIPAESLTPIPLTPTILVDWCGFKDMKGNIYIKDELSLVWHGKGVYSSLIGKFDYLHELQNLYYVLNRKELAIKELQNLETFPAK